MVPHGHPSLTASLTLDILVPSPDRLPYHYKHTAGKPNDLWAVPSTWRAHSWHVHYQHERDCPCPARTLYWRDVHIKSSNHHLDQIEQCV